jgi:hypothetical protein
MTTSDYDVFELDVDTPEWFEEITARLLSVGVPPTAISKAFNVDVEAVKDFQAELLTVAYGTPEIAEAMSYLMWRAYRDAIEILDSAPATQRTRFITTLLSRQSMILGKQSPEGMNRIRGELESLIASVNIDSPLEPSIYASSEFNPVDREANDSEEGSTG